MANERAIPKAAYASFRKSRKHPQILIDFVNAKRKVITLTELVNGNPDHEKIARHRVDQINQKIALGVFDFLKDAPQKSISLGMLGKKYLDYCQQLVDSGERSRRTLVNDREAFDRIIEVLGNDIEIGDIDKVKINEFAKAYKRKPMMRRPGLRTNESVNQKIRALSAAFSWAVNEQLIPVNPFKYFQKLPEKNPRENINIFLPSQIERFREYFKNKAPGHGAVFEFSLATMARAGGIAALCEADIFREIIDGEPADLAILHEKGKYGKTKNRVVFLDANAMYAIEIMRSWYDRVEEYCDRFMVLKDPSEYITRVKAGKVFFPYETYHSISQMFRRARQELGIKGKMHDLRKTASSLALDQGVSRRIIQEQLGHSDGKVTDNHYLKVTITALVREMRRRKG